jgi:hypothetical protein
LCGEDKEEEESMEEEEGGMEEEEGGMEEAGGGLRVTLRDNNLWGEGEGLVREEEGDPRTVTFKDALGVTTSTLLEEGEGR